MNTPTICNSSSPTKGNDTSEQLSEDGDDDMDTSDKIPEDDNLEAGKSHTIHGDDELTCKIGDSTTKGSGKGLTTSRDLVCQFLLCHSRDVHLTSAKSLLLRHWI